MDVIDLFITKLAVQLGPWLLVSTVLFCTFRYTDFWQGAGDVARWPFTTGAEWYRTTFVYPRYGHEWSKWTVHTVQVTGWAAAFGGDHRTVQRRQCEECGLTQERPVDMSSTPCV